MSNLVILLLLALYGLYAVAWANVSADISDKFVGAIALYLSAILIIAALVVTTVQLGERVEKLEAIHEMPTTNEQVQEGNEGRAA